MIDGFGITAAFSIRATATVLPAVLDQGVILDLSFLRAQLPDFDNEANWQVWLSPTAPPDATARLRAAGLVIGPARTEHARLIELGRQGPALSLFLLLACAIVGSVLAVGGTAISISASARRRSFEMAALRTVGVTKPALYRAGVLEQLLLLGTAVVLGIPAGILAARLAMPVIPEFADTTPIALQYGPNPVPVVLFAIAFSAIVGLSAAVASYAVLRAARPGRLREAEE
jgi:predicted lysophospholipase L1 biosynthesis ABC-type transport system permease subunit